MGRLTWVRTSPAVSWLLAAAVVLAWLNGLAVRAFAVDFQFFGETANRTDYLVGSGACLATAALLLAALVVLLVDGRPGWLLVLICLGTGSQLAFGLLARDRAAEASAGPTDQSAWTGVVRVVAVPGSWPLLVAVLALVVVRLAGRGDRTVTGSSYPGPRSQPDP